MIHDFSKVETIVFDKTGTLTMGNPKVADTEIYTDQVDETEYFSVIEWLPFVAYFFCKSE